MGWREFGRDVWRELVEDWSWVRMKTSRKQEQMSTIERYMPEPGEGRSVQFAPDDVDRLVKKARLVTGVAIGSAGAVVETTDGKHHEIEGLVLTLLTFTKDSDNPLTENVYLLTNDQAWDMAEEMLRRNVGAEDEDKRFAPGGYM